jgi:hypothetical protein
MQEGALEEMETLWPYGGFTVRASERKLGEGRLTLTEQSFLFEAKSAEIIGFDFPALRLIRLRDPNSAEVVYSIQGELRNASFRVICTFPDGTERDELPSKEDSYRTSLFRAITGGVVARFVSDHSSAKIEGLTKMNDEKFEARCKDLHRNIQLFPSKQELDAGVFLDDALKKQSLEEAEMEPSIWEDPERTKLFFTGTSPGMTLDNALEKLDLFQEDWVSGRISPIQRAKVVALDYLVDSRQYDLGYTGVNGEPPQVWKDGAERLVKFERQLGVDVLAYV